MWMGWRLGLWLRLGSWHQFATHESAGTFQLQIYFDVQVLLSQRPMEYSWLAMSEYHTSRTVLGHCHHHCSFHLHSYVHKHNTYSLHNNNKVLTNESADDIVRCVFNIYHFLQLFAFHSLPWIVSVIWHCWLSTSKNLWSVIKPAAAATGFPWENYDRRGPS